MFTHSRSTTKEKESAQVAVVPSPPASQPKGTRFWVILLSLCITLWLYALELTAVSTALPTIANDLHATEFIWVGSAYALASTAFVPMSGGLAEVFGRKPAILLNIMLFCIGSAICGAAHNMNMMVAGRTVQGLGGGGIQALAYIVLADLVSLEERGSYIGLFGLTFGTAGFIGPLVGGGLTSQGAWRWIFYLNIPIASIAAALVIVCMNLPTPKGTIYEKILRLDWIGNLIVVASTTSCTIALTWGGIVAPWGSARVLVPLIMGLVGLVGFVVYETTLAEYPLIPFRVMSNRTSVSGYIQAFFSGMIALGAAYFLPVFYQACKNASPIRCGVLILGLSSYAPTFVLTGISVRRTQRYRPQMFLGWALMMIGLGLLSTIKPTSTEGMGVGFGIITGVGLGMVYATTVFPVQAPLPVSLNSHSLSFLLFIRSFATVWGITIGSTVLQNQLKLHLPSQFFNQVPQGVSVTFALIPQIPTLPPPLADNVRQAFSKSLSVYWDVLAGIAGMGLLSAIFMRGIPLGSSVDEKWAFKAAVEVAPEHDSEGP